MAAVGSFASLRMTFWCSFQHSPTGARRISLETRIQAAVGDTYRVLKELGGGGMSRVQPAVRDVRSRLAQLAREPGG
jgi:hypothetical protein